MAFAVELLRPAMGVIEESKSNEMEAAQPLLGIKKQGSSNQLLIDTQETDIGARSSLF